MNQSASRDGLYIGTALADGSAMWPLTGAMAGLLVGSFLATLVLRWPADIGLGGRSRCDGCGAQLRLWELVPIVSWLLLGGRCRRCRARIDWRHPLVELAAMGLGAIALASVPGWPGFATALLFWMLLALLVLDVEHFWLPDRITLPLLLAGLVLGPAPLAQRAMAAAIAGAAMLALALGYRALRGRDGLGLGDVKMAAGIGAWLTPALLGPLMLLAATIGIMLLFIRFGRGQGFNGGTRLPFGACLAIAAVPLHLAVAAHV